jgi:hypothetical protein
MRLNAQTGAMEAGFVHLPSEAHWLADYLHELVTFPRGRYDDQVDSTAQALAWSKQSQSTGIIEYTWTLCERNKHPVQKMVKLRAPAGVTHVYTMTGQQFVVRDGMVEVSEENRKRRGFGGSYSDLSLENPIVSNDVFARESFYSVLITASA